MHNSRGQSVQTIGRYCRWLPNRKWFLGDWNREHGAKLSWRNINIPLYIQISAQDGTCLHPLWGLSPCWCLREAADIPFPMKSEWHLFCLIDMFIETLMFTLTFILSLCMEARVKLSPCLRLLGSLTTGTHHCAWHDLKYFWREKRISLSS